MEPLRPELVISRPRYGPLNGVRSTRCPDLGSCVGVCRICLDSRISPGLPERRKRHHRWQHWQGQQERRPQSRPARVVRLRKVTALVPEDCAEGFRQFARELRRDQEPGARPAGRVWRRLTPSAELMVDLQSGARCTIRYTELPGWAVTIGPLPYLGEPDPMASERTGEIGEARRAIGQRITGGLSESVQTRDDRGKLGGHPSSSSSAFASVRSAVSKPSVNQP